MTQRPSLPTLEFRKRESIRKGVARLGETLARTATDLASAPAPANDPAQAVHGLRLLLKRARALVRLLRETLDDPASTRMRSRLRLAARRLARARDRKVVRTLLEDLATQADATRQPLLQQVRRNYESRIARTDPAPKTTKTQLRQSAQELTRWARSLSRSPWEETGWRVLEKGLHASFRRARKRFEHASTLSRENAFHSWRTAVKTMQYQISFLRPASPKSLTRLLRDLDRLGTCLGAEHDLAVLDDQLVQHAQHLGRKSDVRTVRRLVANRQQFHRKESLKLGRRLFAKSPSDFVRTLHRAWKRWRRA